MHLQSKFDLPFSRVQSYGERAAYVTMSLCSGLVASTCKMSDWRSGTSVENGLCRCGYTRVETYTYTRLSTSGLIQRGWTSGSTGDYAVRAQVRAPGQPESLVSSGHPRRTARSPPGQGTCRARTRGRPAAAPLGVEQDGGRTPLAPAMQPGDT